jgi:DNA-directed RNA polymerase sigma subunit (sigma70/sigma32)
MLGIGKERVRQIEARALAKVRKAMQEKGIGAKDLI